MARSGQTVNLEELKMGLMLSPLKAKDEDNGGFQLSTLMEEGEGDTQADIDAMDDSEIPDPGEADFDDDEMGNSDSSLFEEEPVDIEGDFEDEQHDDDDGEANYTIHTASSMSPGPAPQLSPLKESSGNSRAAVSSPPEQRREREGFTTIVEENTYDLLQLASPKKQQSAKSTPRSQHTPNTNTYANSNTNSLSTPPDEISLLKTSFPPPTLHAQPQPQSRSGSSSPIKSSKQAVQPKLNPQATPRLGKSNESRLPRPREQPPMQSPLTMASIAAKLAASEREADAARVRAKIKAARANRGTATSAHPTTSHSVSTKDNTKENSREKEERKLMPPPPTPKPSVTNHIEAENSVPKQTDLDFEAREGEENGNVNEGRSRKRKARDLGAGMGNGRGQGKASRRRSTLSPWELESLILGGAGVSPGK